MTGTVLLAAMFAASAAADLPAAKFDCGGTTFDLEKISAERFPVTPGGATGVAERMRDSDPGEVVAATLDWAAARKRPGGACGLAFHYRYRHFKRRSGIGKIFLIVRYMKTDDQGRRVRAQEQWPVKIRETGGQWADYYLENLGVTAKSDSVDLVLDVGDGFGRLEIKDMKPVPGRWDEAMDPVKHLVFVKPVGYASFDDTFHVGKGDVQSMLFEWKLNDRKAQFDWRKIALRFELPKGIRALGAPRLYENRYRSETKPDGTSVVEFTRDGEMRPKPTWAGWSRPSLLVTCDADPGTPIAEGRLTILKDGKPCSKPVALKFAAAEPVRAGAKPKRYFNGFCVCGPEIEFADASPAAAYAETLAAAGVTGINGYDTPFAKQLRKRGCWWQAMGGYYIANGFQIGTHPPTGDKRPADQRFVADDPKYKPEMMANATCPIAVYREDSYFRDYVIPCMKREFGNSKGFMSNWEPNAFYGHGCMCIRCRAAFAKFLGVDESDVARDWPKCAQPGGRFAAQAIKFRAVEHGKMMKTLDKTMRKIQGEGAMGFIPELAWTAFTGGLPEDSLSDEVAPEEYAGSFEWLNVWGPYEWWDATRPYFREKRLPLAVWESAKTIREYVDRTYAPEPPKLTSFPHGTQGHMWMSPPEWLELSLDAYFFNRWEGSLVYFFPRGYDARWWRGFARATTRAGQYEDYVLDGVRTDARTPVEPVPEYAAPCHEVTAYLPASTNVSPLAAASYDLKGGRIVAALNFWEEGEAFFTFRALGLAPGKYTVVSGGKTLWAKPGGEAAWTERELAAGVFVTVGAARTEVFELRPLAENAHKKAVDRMDADAVLRRYRERRGELGEKAAKDRAEEALRTHLFVDGTPMI